MPKLPKDWASEALQAKLNTLDDSIEHQCNQWQALILEMRALVTNVEEC